MAGSRTWAGEPTTGGVYLMHAGERVALWRPDEMTLDEVRLYPGSDYILGGIGNCSGWWLGWGRFNGGRATKERSFRLDANADGIRLSTRARDAADDDAVYEAKLFLSYDAARNSYVYEVVTTLTVPEGRSLRWAPYGDLYEGIEFLNVYASGMFNDAGASPIDDLGRIGARGWSNQERYRGWVYQDAAGEWTYMPLNHIVSSPSFARRVCPDSRWILVGEADRAPTVELLGETWRHAHVGICHYIYDTHFNYLPETNPLPAGTVLRAHYRLSNTPRAEAEARWREAKTLPVPEDERRATDFPVCTWTGLDTFTEGVHHGCYDPHRFWQPFVRGPHPAVRPWRDPAIRHNHEAMQRYRFPQSEAIRFGWNPVCPDRRGGFVWVENDVPAASGWGLFFNGAVPYLADRPYRVTAWVRGAGVKGAGIALGVKPGNQKETTWTGRVAGDAGWQKLELELPPLKANLVSGARPPGLVFESNRLDVRFELDGTGRAEMAEVRYSSVR